MIDKIRKQIEAWMPDNPEGDEHISGERMAFRSVLHLLDEIEERNKPISKEFKIGLATNKIICTITEDTLDSLDLCAGDKVVIQMWKE